MTVAAKALGVAISTVNDAMDRGSLETCGLDHHSGYADGVWYPSQHAAAEAMGIKIGALRYRIKIGKVQWQRP
jgi:hypothetical protein